MDWLIGIVNKSMNRVLNDGGAPEIRSLIL